MVIPLAEKPVHLHPLLSRAIDRAQESGETFIVRLPEPKAPRDPWDLAQAALWAGEPSSLWSDPDGRQAAVGLMEAWRIEASGAERFNTLEDRLHALQDRIIAHEELQQLPLWFGGFRFDDAPSDDPHWKHWPSAYLMTHAITAVRGLEKNYIVLTLVVRPEDNAASVAQEYQRLREILAALRSMDEDEQAIDLHFREVDDKAAWDSKVAAVHEAIQDGTLKKLVLARRVHAPWPENTPKAPMPARLLPALRVMRTRYQHCTTFALSQGEVRGDSVFFGSTPELLIASQGERLQTMALAGTAPRGTTPEDDRAQSMALLGSPKEREEHAFVVDDIIQNLASIDIQVRAPSAPDVVSYRNVHHLCTPIHGQKPPDRGLLRVAKTLHPTPAICGTDTAAAFEWLRAHEGMDRGWYAGGVCWLNDMGEGRVSVALRSGIADAQGVRAYAGAGIVEGSDATREWEETRAKLSPVCDAFQVQAAIPLKGIRR